MGYGIKFKYTESLLAETEDGFMRLFHENQSKWAEFQTYLIEGGLRQIDSTAGPIAFTEPTFKVRGKNQQFESIFEQQVEIPASEYYQLSSSKTVIFPIHNSILGVLILNQFTNGNHEIAVGVFLAWLESEFLEHGKKLLESMPVTMADRGLYAHAISEYLNFRNTNDGAIAQREDQLRGLLEKYKVDYQKLYNDYDRMLNHSSAVKLWGIRRKLHAKNSEKALMHYYGLIGITGLMIIVLMAGVLISDFGTAGFALHDVFVVSLGTILFTIFLWVIRLQHKVFLSERHLSLDAAERGAFAGTYLAMAKDTEMNDEAKKLILASLLRPTQDGIIKDDDNSIDPSIAGVISKFMPSGR